MDKMKLDKIVIYVLVIILMLIAVPTVITSLYSDSKFLSEDEACNTLSCYWNTSFVDAECRHNQTHQATTCAYGQPEVLPLGKPINIIVFTIMGIGIMMFVLKWVFGKD